MSIVISTCLANDGAGEWRLAFEFGNHQHLYVRFKPSGESEDDPLSYISIDDFLAWRPRDALHQKALDNCVAWLARSIETAQRG